MNRTRVKELLRAGRVEVNGTPVTRHDHILKPGDSVTIGRETRRLGGPDLTAAGIRVAFEDDHLIILDKPIGLLTVATEGEKLDTAFAHLNRHLRDRKAGRPFVVHRLDRDTSGLVLFAKIETARDKLQASWPTVTKTYLAVTEGVPDPAEGVVDNYLTEGRDLKVRASSVPPPGREAGRQPLPARGPDQAPSARRGRTGNGAEAPDPRPPGRPRLPGDRRQTLWGAVRPGTPARAARLAAGVRPPGHGAAGRSGIAAAGGPSPRRRGRRPIPRLTCGR